MEKQPDRVRVTWCVGQMPRDVKNRFVGLCRMQGKTVQDVVEELILKYVRDNLGSSQPGGVR